MSRLNWNDLLNPRRARPSRSETELQQRPEETALLAEELLEAESLETEGLEPMEEAPAQEPADRRHPLDLRNPFEKDYHRILQSASFRRLQDKTQVFPLDQSDFVRTRLTHSLEVSSLAKSLGQQVCRRLWERELLLHNRKISAEALCERRNKQLEEEKAKQWKSLSRTQLRDLVPLENDKRTKGTASSAFGGQKKSVHTRVEEPEPNEAVKQRQSALDEAKKLLEEAETRVRELPAVPSQEQAAAIGDLLLCAGLIHDIGNPPFGHYGETTIRLWFRDKLPQLSYNGQPVTSLLNEQMVEDFLHYEGNAQAVRVLSKLHFLVDEYGMNLTYPLLNVLMKYPVSSIDVNPQEERLELHKMGYFYAERELFEAVTETTGTAAVEPRRARDTWVDENRQLAFLPEIGVRAACRHPLTYLLEAADDIAYRTADIEDAYKKNKLTYEQLVLALKRFPKTKSYPAEQLGIYQELLRILQDKRKAAMHARYPEPEAYAIQNWVVRAQAILLDLASEQFVEHYGEIMEGDFHRDLFEGTQAEPVLEALGDIAYSFVFHSRQIIKMELAADAILGGLLDLFVPASILYDTNQPMNPVQQRLMDIVSDNYMLCYSRESRGKSEGEKLYLRLLLVTDYIAGMTDNYAKGLYQELTGKS